MRNLKRALSLALAAVMVIGMMVIGAGATSFNDFTDKNEIVNQDAVSMLVSLGVINGKTADTFVPKGNVTRAEMAKMISVILNKGADNNELFASISTPLTDISNNWAKGHINYCYSQNIISGRGNNKFDPDANVTAAEAAKMLLIATGYDPKIEGFTGATWAIKVSALASKLGIYDNFDKDTMTALNRDDAALLIFNALDTEMIEKYDTNGYALGFADHRTILSVMYGVIKVEGVVTANEWAVLDDDMDSVLKDGLTRITNPDGIFSTTTSTTVNDPEKVINSTFKVSTPVDMLGRTVVLYVKKATILADSKVYGEAVLSKSNNVVEGNDKTISGKTSDDNSLAKMLKSSGLSTDKDTEYYLNYQEYDPADRKSGNADLYNVKGADLTVIDNNNDGVVDYVLSLEKTLTAVTKVSTKDDEISLANNSTNYNNNTTPVYRLAKIDKDIVVEGLSKDYAVDDVVLYVQYGGRVYVEKPDVVTGVMDSYNIKNTTNQTITVNGEKYKASGIVTSEKSADLFGLVMSEVDSDIDPDGVQFDNTYDFFLDNHGNIAGYRKTASSADKWALILDSAYSVNGLKLSGDAKLLLSDNTSGTYSVDMSATATRLKTRLADLYVLKFGSASNAARAAALADTRNNDFIKKSVTVTLNDKDEKGKTVSPYVTNIDFVSYGTATETGSKFVAGTANMYTENEILRLLMGTSDAGTLGEGKVNNVGAGKGALIKYSMTDDNVVTLDFVVRYDLENEYLTTTGIKKESPVLLTHTAANHGPNDAGVRTTGIDMDTVVFYYDKNNDAASVAVGYKDMLSVDQKYNNNTKDVTVSAILKKDKELVNAMVVNTPVTSSKNYVLILAQHNKNSQGIFTYTVVTTAGEIKSIESKQDLNLRNTVNNVGNLLYTITYDVGSKYADFHTPDQSVDGYAYGVSEVTGNLWIRVGNSGRLSTLGVNGKGWNIYDASTDDATADAISLKSGQLVYAVYDKDTLAVKAAFIIKESAGSDAELGVAPVLTNIRIGGVNTSIEAQNTQAKAVAANNSLRLNQAQANSAAMTYSLKNDTTTVAGNSVITYYYTKLTNTWSTTVITKPAVGDKVVTYAFTAPMLDVYNSASDARNGNVLSSGSVGAPGFGVGNGQILVAGIERTQATGVCTTAGSFDAVTYADNTPFFYAWNVTVY